MRSYPFSVCVPITMAVSPLIRTCAVSVVSDPIEKDRYNSIVSRLVAAVAVLVRLVESRVQNAFERGRVLIQLCGPVRLVGLHYVVDRDRKQRYRA